MKKTQWFPGEVKPVRDGVYEKTFNVKGRWQVYSRWRDNRWHRFCSTPYAAYKDEERSRHQNDLPWRGLAQDPNKR